jgi:hypothetical protein
MVGKFASKKIISWARLAHGQRQGMPVATPILSQSNGQRRWRISICCCGSVRWPAAHCGHGVQQPAPAPGLTQLDDSASAPSGRFLLGGFGRSVVAAAGIKGSQVGTAVKH